MKRTQQTDVVPVILPALLVLSVVSVVACSSSDDDSTTTDAIATIDQQADDESVDLTSDAVIDTVAVGALDPEQFVSGALATDVTIEDCVLSGGTETTCYRITINGEPTDPDEPVGPFCPTTITSTAEESGIWFDGSGIVYDADGDFVLDLPNIYGDNYWQLYDEATGEVNVVGGAEGCEGAGDPNNAPEDDNFCVECPLEEIGGGLQQTLLIPTTPVPLDAPANNMNQDVGVALNGVLFGPPAPIDFILSTYTLGVFDDCGGHVNPLEGYHYHAANGCSEAGIQDDGHSALMGFAMDGYGIYGRLDSDGNESTALDECLGETDDVRGYHYHAAAAGENRIIGCFQAEQGTKETTTVGTDVEG